MHFKFPLTQVGSRWVGNTCPFAQILQCTLKGQLPSHSKGAEGLVSEQLIQWTTPSMAPQTGSNPAPENSLSDP